MRKVFLLAATALMVAGSVAFAGVKSGAPKKQVRTQCQCPKGCNGAACAPCCQVGQCVKSK